MEDVVRMRLGRIKEDRIPETVNRAFSVDL